MSTPYLLQLLVKSNKVRPSTAIDLSPYLPLPIAMHADSYQPLLCMNTPQQLKSNSLTYSPYS